MNKQMIARILGILLLAEGALLLLPCAVALYYKEHVISSFLVSIAVSVILGLILIIFKPKSKTIYSRDGFIIVSLGWIVLSLVGALPFFISGEIPSYLDAVFESVSGFTTTGASILTDVEALSKSMLFWRSFTHWIGGMGVLVFIMAVLPLSGGGGDLHLMRAESPGPNVGKLVPKSNNSARILYSIYLGMTILEIILLRCGDMPLFDSVTLTFGTAGTGGFGIKNTSLASYSVYSQSIITIFMALFGVNFNIYFLLLCGKIKDVLKSEELRYYFIIMLGTVGLITINIHNMFSSTLEAFRAAAFQVSSVMTTTGYTTVDFNKWPEFSRLLMLLVMCCGACAGSTGGGIKVSRILLMLKSTKREFKKIAHPRSVKTIRFDSKKVDIGIIHQTNVYFVVYMIIFVASLIIVSLDKTDMVTNISGVIATLNNIGPGLGLVGATGNYAICSGLTKIVYIFDMLLGRLELYPLLLLFTPNIRIKKHANINIPNLKRM